MIRTNPLSIPLEQVGVTDDHFDHRSELHGKGHVNRVIFNALLIARTMGYNDIIPECWAAAYVHDLARTHDGPCQKHGGWAAYNHLPKHREFFASAGVKDFDAVEDAVLRHSLNGPVGENSDNRVCNVLKDADALDRCRLGDLDPKYLRLEKTQYMVGMAERLYQRTKDDGSWGNVWKVGVEVFNPHAGMAEKYPPQFDPSEAPRDRMLRRLNSSDYSKLGLPVVAKLKRWLEYNDLANDLVSSCPLEEGVPVIYMSDEGLDAFKRDGVFKTVWERGATWHDKFGDNPLDARAYTERRLFGESCGKMAHGSMFAPKVFGDHQDERLRKMYGKKRVRLNKSVLDSTSFTINDSQASYLALPWDIESAKVMVTAAHVSNFADVKEISKLFCNKPALFIELQFHQPITFDLVAAIE